MALAVRLGAPNTAVVPRLHRFGTGYLHGYSWISFKLRFLGIWLLPFIGIQDALSAQVAEPSDSATEPSSYVVDPFAEMDIGELMNVRVSPFDVASYQDRGYRASNSVTGSRFNVPIRELPVAIQAFTRSFIEDLRPDNIFDIARYSPGVTYRSNDFNEGNANLAIRGFAVGTNKGSVQVLRDGFNGPSIFDFTNVSRLEIVKGPSSFLYGQVAPGGIANIITKRPLIHSAAEVGLSYGSYGEYRLDADITGPVSDGVYFRLASSYDQDMHYWEPYDAHSWDFAPSLLWRLSERASLAVSYERFHKVEEPQLMQKPGYGAQVGWVESATDPNRSGVDVPGLPDNWNGLAYSDYRNSDTESVSAWFDYSLDDHWDLRLGYAHQYSEIDAVASGNFGMANNTTLLQGRRVRGQTYSNWGNSYESHAVGNYDFGDTSLRLLVGAQHSERRFDDWAAQAPNDPALGDDPTASPLPLWDLGDPTTWDYEATIPRSEFTENPTDTRTDYQEKSVYAGSTFGFFEDRLLLLAGWRLTSTENRFTDRLSNQTDTTYREREVTPQYGALYKLNPEFSLYASYAESFVPPSQVIRNTDGTTQSAKPTQGEGYDVGVKADLLGGLVSGTLTYFDIRNRNIVNDLATTNSLGSVIIYNVQSGEQRSQGVELSLTATPTDNWQIYFSYSYMDARITEFSGNDDAILAQDPASLDEAGQANYRNVARLHDAPLQMSAPHLANLWTRYDFTGDSLRGLYLAGGFNYVRDQTILPDGPKSSRQTYTLYNLKAGYQWKWRDRHMSLDLMGKNLGDEHYRPSQSSRSRPREYILSLTARF
jgi:iron complex outermembrane recepter protein